MTLFSHQIDMLPYKVNLALWTLVILCTENMKLCANHTDKKWQFSMDLCIKTVTHSILNVPILPEYGFWSKLENMLTNIVHAMCNPFITKKCGISYASFTKLPLYLKCNVMLTMIIVTTKQLEVIWECAPYNGTKNLPKLLHNFKIHQYHPNHFQSPKSTSY